MSRLGMISGWSSLEITYIGPTEAKYRGSDLRPRIGPEIHPQTLSFYQHYIVYAMESYYFHVSKIIMAISTHFPILREDHGSQLLNVWRSWATPWLIT